MCGTGVLPVAKPKAVAAWSTAPEEDEGENEQADHHDDFGASEPELGLAVEAHGHEVETDDDDEHDGDPDGYVDVVGPVIDDESGGCDLVWN